MYLKIVIVSIGLFCIHCITRVIVIIKKSFKWKVDSVAGRFIQYYNLYHYSEEEIPSVISLIVFLTNQVHLHLHIKKTNQKYVIQHLYSQFHRLIYTVNQQNMTQMQGNTRNISTWIRIPT